MGAVVRVKVCGITREEDALAAASVGADAVGLVFWEGSKRAVSVESAARICRSLPPFVSVVALFVDAEASKVEKVLSSVPVNLIQWHGRETPEFCEQWNFPYLRALPSSACAALEAEMAGYPSARGFLLDAVHQGQFGGTGQAFDWSVIPGTRSRPLVLAGGLDADNVREAITQVRPAAVDVSSGVESAPGIKDPEKMARFVTAAKQAAKGMQHD